MSKARHSCVFFDNKIIWQTKTWLMKGLKYFWSNLTSRSQQVCEVNESLLLVLVWVYFSVCVDNIRGLEALKLTQFLTQPTNISKKFSQELDSRKKVTGQVTPVASPTHYRSDWWLRRGKSNHYPWCIAGTSLVLISLRVRNSKISFAKIDGLKFEGKTCAMFVLFFITILISIQPVCFTV